MADSSYVMNAALYPRYAKGYQGGREASRPTLRDQPTGSLFSTAPDLARLMSAVFADGRGVVSPEALAEMRRAQHPGLPLDFGHVMGLGWMLSGMTMADGRSLLWHGGTAIPFQAFLAMDPEAKLGVAVLSNSEEASRFISTIAVKALELALEAKTGRKPPPAAKSRKPAPVAVPPADLARYTGDYATFAAQLGSVWLDGGELKMWLWDRMVDLAPIGKDSFLPRQETFLGWPPGPCRTVLRIRHRPGPGSARSAWARHALPLREDQARCHSQGLGGPARSILHRPARRGHLLQGAGAGQEGWPPGGQDRHLFRHRGDAERPGRVSAGSGLGRRGCHRGHRHEHGSGGAGEGAGLYHSGYDFKRMP